MRYITDTDSFYNDLQSANPRSITAFAKSMKIYTNANKPLFEYLDSNNVGLRVVKTRITDLFTASVLGTLFRPSGAMALNMPFFPKNDVYIFTDRYSIGAMAQMAIELKLNDEYQALEMIFDHECLHAFMNTRRTVFGKIQDKMYDIAAIANANYENYPFDKDFTEYYKAIFADATKDLMHSQEIITYGLTLPLFDKLLEQIPYENTDCLHAMMDAVLEIDSNNVIRHYIKTKFDYPKTLTETELLRLRLRLQIEAKKKANQQMSSGGSIAEETISLAEGIKKEYSCVLLKDGKRYTRSDHQTEQLAWAAGENWKMLNPSHDYRIVNSVIFSDAFKNWFGDWEKDPKNSSKMIDEQGFPIVCYHGTNYDFNEFRKDWIGSVNDRGFYGRGFYFTFNKDPKWFNASKGEAAYYGKKIKEVYLRSLNPFDISSLSNYKGKQINIMGTEPVVFLMNIAIRFPEIADTIFIDKKTYIPDEEAYNISEVPISVLPELFKKYSALLKTETVYDDNKPSYISGYVKSEIVEYDYTANGGKKGSYESTEDLGRYPLNYDAMEIEAGLIVEAIEKYDGIEARYQPEGYMTRNPQITDTIKSKGHDAIVTSMEGDEIVVFEPTQIKAADGSNVTFDANNPDIRFKYGGLIKYKEYDKNDKAYVAIRIEDQTFEQLKNRKLEGVQGISYCPSNYEWFSHRDAWLQMDRKEFELINKFDQIKYDDVDYLCKNGLEAYFRIHSSSRKNREYRSEISKIFEKSEEFFMAYLNGISNPETAEEKDHYFKTYNLKEALNPYISGHFINELAKGDLTKINNFNDFFDHFRRIMISAAKTYTYRKVDFDNYNFDKIKGVLEDILIRTASIYRNECEVLMIDYILNVPKNTNLVFMVNERSSWDDINNVDEESREKSLPYYQKKIAEYGLDKIYNSIEFDTHKEINKKAYTVMEDINKSSYNENQELFKGIDEKGKQGITDIINDFKNNIYKKTVELINTSITETDSYLYSHYLKNYSGYYVGEGDREEYVETNFFQSNYFDAYLKNIIEYLAYHLKKEILNNIYENKPENIHQIINYSNLIISTTLRDLSERLEQYNIRTYLTQKYGLADKIFDRYYHELEPEAILWVLSYIFESILGTNYEPTDYIKKEVLAVIKEKYGYMLGFNNVLYFEQGGEIAQSVSDVTQTEAFKKWFKDSKIVDEQGKPLIVYHGFCNDPKYQPFTIFDTDGNYAKKHVLPDRLIGAHFAKSKLIAKRFSENLYEKTYNPNIESNCIPVIYQVYLSIQNPFRVDQKMGDWIETDQYSIQKLIVKALCEDISLPEYHMLFNSGRDKDELTAIYNYYKTGQELSDEINKKYHLENQETLSDFINNWLHPNTKYSNYIAERGKNILIKKGYDGLIYINTSPMETEGIRHENRECYIAFHSNQIKLADGTNTTFNPENPDIRFEEGGKLADKKQRKIINLLDKADACILNQDCDGFLIDEIIGEIKNTYIDNQIAEKIKAESVNEQRKKVIELIKKPDTKIMLAFSGGKDSIAMVFHLLELGIPKERIELHHHDIDGHAGDLFDWACTVDYCKAFAKQLGLKIFFSYRDQGIVGGIYRKNEPLRDVYYQDKTEGKFVQIKSDPAAINTQLKFPAVSADLQTRWCSSYVKIDVLKRIITNNAIMSEGNIIVLTGERRAESVARSKYKEIQIHSSSNKKRLVIGWRCVIDYSDEDVWNMMKKYNIQPHPAYELGWSRCSCQTCIFNSPNTWASLAQISPEKIDKIEKIENDIGNTLYFKKIKGKAVKMPIREKVASGKSFITSELENKWKDQATKAFTLPIYIKEWTLPSGAKSTEVSGAN